MSSIITKFGIRNLAFILIIALVIGLIPVNESHATSTTSMKIYSIYMKRASGTAYGSDRYGDAVLIESGGKYLLMDVGDNKPIKNSDSIYASNLPKTLKNIGVKELDVYISHLHQDHMNGLEDICKNFKVNKVYLPDPEIAKDYVTPNSHEGIEIVRQRRLNIIAEEGAEVVYLSPSFREHASEDAISKFTVGTANFEVIGPVGDFTLSQFKAQDGKCGTMEGHYLNCYSLVTMVTCGNTKYLTSGDIELQEETKMVEKYGSKLNADIMKANHHALYTSNSSKYVSAVSPKWSFEQNHGFLSSGSISASISNMQKYGYNYAIATNKTTMIIDIKNDKVRIYKDTNGNGKADEKYVTGWVKSGSNYQYYKLDGTISSGWGSKDGNKYYLSPSTGFRYTGTHKINGTTCKFSSTGVLTSPGKPDQVEITSGKAYTVKKKKKTYHKIKLTWEKAAGATGYKVYKYSAKKKAYVEAATLGKDARSYVSSGYTKGKTYKFKVYSVKSFAKTSINGVGSKAKSVKAK